MNPSAQPICLPSTFDATTVREVYATLRRALASEGELLVDGTGVETVDTAAGQLLASFALTGRHVHLRASKPLADFLKVTAIEVVLAPEQ
jgi:anti-anti-sigma regulatory factor